MEKTRSKGPGTIKWRRSPPELVELFEESVKGLEGIEPRKMFGYPCAFVNGNMFVGLHQENLVLRLAEADREAIVGEGLAEPFVPMPGRPMREYVSVSEEVLGDRRLLKSWLRKSHAFSTERRSCGWAS